MRRVCVGNMHGGCVEGACVWIFRVCRGSMRMDLSSL